MHARLLTVALGLTAVAAVSAAEAQVVRGLPVYNSGVNKFLNVAVDAGWPNDAAGGGTAYGLTGAMKFGPLGVAATVGQAEGIDGDSHRTFGASIATQIIGGPLMPVSVTLQGGLARALVASESDPDFGEDIDETRAPLGIGVALKIPIPFFTMKPWIAPRVHYTDFTGSNNSSTDFAISGGIDFDFVFGLGVRLGYDKIFTDADEDPDVFGLGAYWRFGL